MKVKFVVSCKAKDLMRYLEESLKKASKEV